MKAIEAQELESHVSEILREVESGETVEVMRHGQVVARVVPAQAQAPDKEAIRKALADIDRLAAEIGKQWPEGVSAEDAVNDVRGDAPAASPRVLHNV